jgi:hypothetical protein
MDSQRTPPRATAAAAEEPSQSTPHSKGTSDHSDFASTGYTQEHYAPFLEEDIADEITVTVENFLLWIMGGKRGEEGKLQAILDHPKFATLMANYLPRPALETGLYHPFVTLANWCLDQMGIEHMKFCRNDPQYILDSNGKRKPDVVIVDSSVFDTDGRYKDRGVDVMSKAGPQEAPFYWRELLSFWEFKIDGALPAACVHTFL